MHRTGGFFAWHERGFSILGIVLALGAVMSIIGLAMLLMTDAEVKEAKLDQVLRNSDWTVRSAIKLTEDCWRRYLGQEGPIYTQIKIETRDATFQDAIANGNSLYVFLPALREGNTPPSASNPPDELVFRVNLSNPNGIVVVDDGLNPPNDTPIWNNIGSTQRQFDARIAVRPNGAPAFSADFGWFTFPVRFQIDLQTRTSGLRNNQAVDRAITGRGSCTFYVRQRSYCEYILFADEFLTETGGKIWFPNGFTYEGPVHTNGQFRFCDDPSTTFGGIVTQTGEKAIFGQGSSFGWEYERADDHLDEIINGVRRHVYPTFEKGGLNKGFFLGVPEISLDDALTGLEDLADGVWPRPTRPTENGVYLVTLENSNILDTGGIYIKGDVESLTLSQGDRTQTYVISGNVTIAGETTTSIVFSDFARAPYTEANARMKTVTETTPVNVTTHTITCDYDENNTSWRKEAVRKTQKVEKVYRRSKTSNPWPTEPISITTTLGPAEFSLPVTNDSYEGVIDAVVDDEDDEGKTPQQKRKQAAIYIDGSLGVLGEHWGDYQTKAPTGLSGKLDIDTELTICAKGKVVISGDIKYESHASDAKNILGIISETDIVYLDYDLNDPNYDPNNPDHDKNIDIDAHIMAPYENESAGKYGVLKAADAGCDITPNGGGKPYINLYGGVVQRRYGAVSSGDTDVNGYIRNFKYDPRLMNLTPPLYPKQDSYVYKFEDENNELTLQIFWSIK